MIAEKVLDLVRLVLVRVLGWLPGYEFQPVSGGLSSANDLLRQWIDIGAMVSAIGVVLAAFAAGAGIKAVRILISHVTGGGGSAA